jgi:hypothetical protein
MVTKNAKTDIAKHGKKKGNLPKMESCENKLGYCFAGYKVQRLNKNQQGQGR